MAREPQAISDSIDAQLNATLTPLGVVLSSSQVADWKLWRDTVVNTDYTFEVIMDVFKADVQAYIDSKQIGSLAWYALQALAFQYGDDLLVSEEGIIYYAVIDDTKKIVKLASVKEEEASGVVTLVMKVATIDDTETVQPLTDDEMLGFQDYMKNIKIVGTKLQIVSQDADTIQYEVDVIYNPEFAQANVEANILAALETFRTLRGFDPTFYKSSFEAAILSAEGVVALAITLLKGTPDGGSPADITLGYELEAGYFNYDVASVINLTAE